MLAGELISCSIDPTPAGLKRFARVMRGNRASPSAQLLRRMEQAVGPQTITLTGVSPESHFAQVLVAADWQMKRLGMGLVPSPVDGLTSYLELLNDDPDSTPRTALPRWWIAYGEAARGAGRRRARLANLAARDSSPHGGRTNGARRSDCDSDRERSGGKTMGRLHDGAVRSAGDRRTRVRSITRLHGSGAGDGNSRQRRPVDARSVWNCRCCSTTRAFSSRRIAYRKTLPRMRAR